MRCSPTFGSVCRSLPIFKPTPWLEDLGDYMITTGLQTTDARSRVKMPELLDTSKSKIKKSLLDRKLGGLLFVPYLTTHSRRDTWNALKPETSSTGPYRMFSQHSVPIQGVDNAASLPTPTFGIVYRATNHHINLILTDYLRIPAKACQNHVSTSEDTPTSPTSKLSAKSITNALYK
ncbi:unnamed protein product [Prunus armeniaca]